MKTILLAGGAGYIGSHTAVELLNAGFQVVVADNYSNSCPEAVKRVEEITGKSVKLYEVDIKDSKKLETVFQENHIDAVIHFAGLKAVGESVEKPLEYYENNVSGTLTLLRVMRKYGCRTMIFSSSATVYGSQNPVPYREEMPTSATNPLWLYQGDDRTDSDGYRRGQPRLAGIPASIFQPHRRAQKRAFRRKSQRHPQ